MSSPKDGGHYRLPLNDTARRFIDDLPTADQTRLEALIAAAAEQQHAALNTAMDGAMRIVPAPFRNKIRKLLLD